MTMHLPLQLHPDCVSGVRSIEVDVSRTGPKQLAVRYHLSGGVGTVRTPTPFESHPFPDELWRTTCFELFARAGDESGYYEFNFAPTGEWAAYRFDDYRHGKQPLRLRGEPRRQFSRSPVYRAGEPYSREADRAYARENANFAVDLDLAELHGLTTGQPLHVGLSAVIEERNGRLSYWALDHPSGKPDFHHPDCFALDLAPARPA